MAQFSKSQKGIIHLLSIFVVTFLFLSLVVGKMVVNNSNLNFDIREKALGVQNEYNVTSPTSTINTTKPTSYPTNLPYRSLTPSATNRGTNLPTNPSSSGNNSVLLSSPTGSQRLSTALPNSDIVVSSPSPDSNANLYLPVFLNEFQQRVKNVFSRILRFFDF